MPSSERTARSIPLLRDALRLLPVQPMKERDELGEARHRASRAGSGEVRGVRVPLDELNELFVGTGAPRISPRGARLLLDLHRRGALEECRDRRVDGGLEVLAAFAEGRASIVGAGFWAKPRPVKAKTAATTARPRGSRDAPSAPNVTPYEPRYRVITHRIT